MLPGVPFGHPGLLSWAPSGQREVGGSVGSGVCDSGPFQGLLGVGEGALLNGFAVVECINVGDVCFSPMGFVL